MRTDVDQEFRYTVEIIFPAGLERNGPLEDEDAIIALEDILKAALPHPRMSIRVVGREPFIPEPPVLLARVEGALDEIKRPDSSAQAFGRLLYYTRSMAASKSSMTQKQREHAERLRQQVRRTIGL